MNDKAKMTESDEVELKSPEEVAAFIKKELKLRLDDTPQDEEWPENIEGS